MPSERFHVYELLDPLQRAGPGRAHQARVADTGGPLEPGALVALRCVGLDEVEDESVLSALVASHANARRIDSKSVVAPVDHGMCVGGAGRQFWSAAPWVDGRTLADVLRTTDIVPDLLTEAVARQVADAIAACHANGVVGLGLSPESILLRADGSAALLDPGFGPAAAWDWLRSGTAPATMLCAAPEILGDGGADPRSDLFSLGAILFRCMTGRWHRPDDAKTLRSRAAEMDGVRPLDERQKSSRFLSEVTYALLRSDPEERIACAVDLVAVLRDRRRSAWWVALDIDGDAPDDAPSRRAPAVPEASAEPAPPAIPDAAPPPDDDWWSQRVLHPGPFADHAARCVGRSEELAHLFETAVHLPTRGAAVVLVEGGAGVGKTRLLDAFLAQLDTIPEARRPFILRGEQRRVGVGRPFGAFTEALTRFLLDDRIATADELAPLLGESAGVAAAFAAVLSSEARPVGGAPLDHANVPPAFLRCLRTMTARSPVVLVVENLQWADPEILGLFGHLARVASDMPLLLVGSFRPAQGPTSLAEMAAAVRSRPNASAIRLAPLDEERMLELARELITPPEVAVDIATHVSADMGGAPEGLIETVRALEAEHHLLRRPDGLREAQTSLGGTHLPRTLADALRRRLAALDERERRFLGAAAVQGVAFDADVARIAAGLDPHAAADVLETLRSRRVIAGGGVARTFASHALFDEVHAGLDDAALAERNEATAAAFLESRNPDQLPPSKIHGILSYRVAWHYLLAGRAARAMLYVNAAVEHLHGTCRHGDGERLVSLACRVVANDSARATEMIDMLLERCRFLGAQGREVEQRETLEEALLRARERRDLFRESRILLEAAKAHHLAGEAARSDLDARQALSCAHRSGELEVEQKVHGWLAQTAQRESRWQDARAHFTAALEIARRRRDHASEAAIHHGLGNVAHACGATVQAEEEFRTALRLHRGRGDLAQEAEALACLGNLAAAGGDLVHSESCLRRALAIHVALGDGHGETRVLGLLAMVLHEGGCLVEARDVHRACLERARRIDARQGEVVARLNVATVDAALGRLDDARDSYGEALRGAQMLEDVRLQGFALTGLGEVARQRGDYPLGRMLLARAMVQFRRTQDPSGLAASLLAAGRIETLAGEDDAARPLLFEAHRLADQQNARQVTAAAESLLALLSARAQDSDDAERRIGEAGLALSDIRASDATLVEIHFLHSLVLRVLGRQVEADRKLFQAEATLRESVKGLPDGDRERVLAALTPLREIVVGAEAARASAPSRIPNRSETVAV